MKVKKLLGQLDVNKQNLVQEKAFFSILELNGVKLASADQQKLVRQCHSSLAFSQHVTQGGLFINFKDALKMLHIDAEHQTDDIKDLHWVIRQ